jgi:hypothetical protein
MQLRGYGFRKVAIGMPLTGATTRQVSASAPGPASLIQRSLLAHEGAGARPTTPSLK